MAITLNDFRTLSNGEYNAGQIDFTTNSNGEVTGLKKVNHHVTFKSLNGVEIDPKRAVAVKEAFIQALTNEGVSLEKIAQIRERLGIAADTKTTLEEASAALKRRFTPLTRQQVRDILRHDVADALNTGFNAAIGRYPGAAVAEARGVRETRERVNREAEALVKKSPSHEQLFALLAGKSCEESVKAAMHSSPAMMQVANGLRVNRMDTLLRNAWNRGVNACLDRAAKTLAALRSAVDVFVGDPHADSQKVKTPFGTITLSCEGNGAMIGTHLVVSLKVGNETLTLELAGSPEEIVEQLDNQISGGAELLGKNRLGAMLSQARKNEDLAEDSMPCLGRTVAETILKTFANVGQDLLDELDNHSLANYARDVANGTANWTEDSIRAARNEALRDADNVKVIAQATELIEGGDKSEEDEVIKDIVDHANEVAKEKEVVNEEVNEVGTGDEGEKKIEPENPAQPPPQGEQVQPPPQEDKFEKLFGAPLPKDANDLLRADFKPALKRGQERRVFNELTLLFERTKARPAHDNASSVKLGTLKEPKRFEAVQKTENFTFAGAKLSQAERKAIGDFAQGLLRGAASGDAAAIKALVAQNVHALLLMAADPEGAAAFFPPEAVADAKGLVASLAEALKTAAKGGTGRTLDFQSFTLGDEDAVRGMLARTKNAAAADALAAKVTTILRESVSVAVRKPSQEVMTAAGAALGGTSVAPLALLARNNTLELMAFVSGDAKIPGRNAAQTAEIKAAVMKAFTAATGRATFAETTLAEFDAFVAKCATGALDKALGAIASRNALFGGELYGKVGGDKGKRVAADIATKDLGAVVKAPQTAQAKKGDIVGGVTLHISDMLDSDAPQPRRATAADLRGLAADLLETAEGIFAKGANASPEAIRAVILKDIDAFCRFLDNPRALGDAVMPQLRDLVVGVMADVRKLMAEALKAALGKELRAVRPVEIKQFVQKMDVAALGKVAAAFATLAEKGAEQVQTFVNGVCNLDPKAKIASEYDKMKPEQIKASLANKTLDDIIDDPINDPSRPGILAFQKKVLSTYFTKVSHARKAGVLVSALRNSPDTAQAASVAAETKFLSAIFLGAGPLMQKTLQGIDRRIAGAHGEAFGVLKSSIPPIPDEYILAKLDEIVENNPDKYLRHVKSDDKPFIPLGAATVGQAVKCSFMTMQGKMEEVIVKIMRPGVKERFEEDVKIFDAVAKDVPSVKKVWDARVATIRDEFDFRVEAKNIEIGQVYEVYDKRYVMVKNKKTGRMEPKEDPKTGLYVYAPGVGHTWTVSAMKTPEGVKQTSDVLVGSVAPGQPFDKLLGTQKRNIHSLFAGVFETDAGGRILRKDGKPVVRKDMSLTGFLAIYNGIKDAAAGISKSRLYFKQVIWKWLEEALFKSGVMHNDVHTGNLMLSTDDHCATFIDFGNIVQLSKNDRLSLLKMVAAVAAKHSDFFIASFEELLGKGTKEQKAFSAMREKVHAAVSAVIHKGKTKDDTGYRFQALLSEMQKLGVDIPPQVATFVEGLTRLQNCYEELSDLIHETESLCQAYTEQVVNGNPDLVPHAPDDVIGKLLGILSRPGALAASNNLDPNKGGIAREMYDVRSQTMDLAWKGLDGTIKGTLVTQMAEAIEAEKNLPGNDKLSHLVSLVSRHAFPDDAAKINGALARFADVKRRLRCAEASGADGRAAELRKELGDAQNKLMRAISDGMEGIQTALDDSHDAEPPDEDCFTTESAAEIFADIVNENFDAVKGSFNSAIGKGKLAYAFKKAVKDDVNHQNDGHQKAKATQL